MTQGFPSGWTQDPNNPTIVRAFVGRITTKSGLTRSLLAETNWSTGATTYYETSTLLGDLSYRIPLFQTNSSTRNLIPINKSSLDQYNPQIFDSFVKSVRQRTYEFNNKYGTDNEKRDLKNSVFYGSLGNTAQTPPQKPQEGGNPEETGGNPNGNQETPRDGGSEPLPPEFIITSVEEKLENPNQLKIAPGGIRYPIKAIGGDVIKFQAVKLIRPEIKGTTADFKNFSFPPPSFISVGDGPIYLPVQSPINDQNSVEWGSDSIDPLSAFAFGLSIGVINSNTPDDVGTKIKGYTNSLMAEVKNQDERIKRSFAGAAASINNILARTDNVIFNPNLELLFNNPQLRPFTFTFKLSAREQEEANVIKKIIKYFKYHMAVRKESTKIFLRAPHVFTIQYMTHSSDGKLIQHQSINQISGSDNKKACALTNCSVDYTPLGSYMTYNDEQKTMVSYTISLQFQEITPIYDTDYSENSHPIGY